MCKLFSIRINRSTHFLCHNVTSSQEIRRSHNYITTFISIPLLPLLFHRVFLNNIQSNRPHYKPKLMKHQINPNRHPDITINRLLYSHPSHVKIRNRSVVPWSQRYDKRDLTSIRCRDTFRFLINLAYCCESIIVLCCFMSFLWYCFHLNSFKCGRVF